MAFKVLFGRGRGGGGGGEGEGVKNTCLEVDLGGRRRSESKARNEAAHVWVACSHQRRACTSIKKKTRQKKDIFGGIWVALDRLL